MINTLIENQCFTQSGQAILEEISNHLTSISGVGVAETILALFNCLSICEITSTTNENDDNTPTESNHHGYNYWSHTNAGEILLLQYFYVYILLI